MPPSTAVPSSTPTPPRRPPGQAYDPRLAPAPGAREHTLTLTATEGVVEVAPGVRQQAWSFNGKVPGPALRPGERLVYQFKAKHAGVYMYHCGTAPTLHHIGNGMYGAIVIDPPGLAKVDHEYLLVQSELYLGPQVQPGSLAKMQSERLDAVVFNGYASQYKF